jgi:iron-sulfur cluster assembly accessory protein
MVELTEVAADALQAAMASVPESIAGLRLVAEPGGCSGPRYQMGLVERAEPSDISCESRGVIIFIEPSSLALITGTTIDYIDDQDGTGFSFRNPQAISKGGCEKSCC